MGLTSFCFPSSFLSQAPPSYDFYNYEDGRPFSRTSSRSPALGSSDLSSLSPASQTIPDLQSIRIDSSPKHTDSSSQNITKSNNYSQFTLSSSISSTHTTKSNGCCQSPSSISISSSYVTKTNSVCHTPSSVSTSDLQELNTSWSYPMDTREEVKSTPPHQPSLFSQLLQKDDLAQRKNAKSV